MKIGILQCGHAPDKVIADHGDLSSMFQRLLAGNGFSFDTFDVIDMDFPADVSDADGWLLTGSRHGAYDDLPFIPPLEDFIRKAYAAAVPMVGICFGHQIIAQALGGRVEKFSGGWAIGKQTYQADGIGPITLNAMHQDQVTQRPDTARKIASNGFCENAALIYGDRALTVQPHPEFSNVILGDILHTRRNLPGYPADIIAGAVADLDSQINPAPVADQIVAFFKQGRGAGHGR